MICAILLLGALNFNGSAWLGVATVENGTALELRLSSGATLPSEENSFSARAVIIGHDYYRLGPKQVNALADALTVWADAPYSDVAFSDGGDIYLTIGGSASNPALGPVLVFNVYTWTSSGAGHHHGGTYITLDVAEVQALAAVLAAWVEKPYSSTELLYTKSFN